jgi:predicted amidohydrolase YtcJ
VERVDVRGKYLVPGFIDLHAHVMPKSLLFPGAKDPDETLRILSGSRYHDDSRAAPVQRVGVDVERRGQRRCAPRADDRPGQFHL